MTDLRAARGLRRSQLGTSAGVRWTAHAVDPVDRPALAELPATVPGEIHADLIVAGLIPDPFDGANETAVAWVSGTHWTYRGAFTWAGGPETRHDLVTEGLDTMATVTLNGALVARTANQHRSYRFDVTDLLREGDNELEIAFEAPAPAAERLSAKLGDRPRVLDHPFNAIRKMASSYGWDWGPDLAGVGIWRPIGIESWSGVRLAAVRPLATYDGRDGALEVHVDLEWAAEAELDAGVEVSVAGVTLEAHVPAGQTSVVLTGRVPDVAAWWPRGYGEPALHDLTVGVAADGDSLDSFTTPVGFRTVALSTAADAAGSEFVISVNGQPVYVKGANWIPDDALLTRLTPATYRTSIREACAAGMNLLRVWGGGIYESEAFYRTCDELGMLVWQDFLFACAAYSEDESLRTEVEAEAREAVTRLSRHPSLVLWNGNNENIWGYVEWGWRAALQGRSWGDGYYTDLLPRVVAELDPRAVYTPGSPHSFAPYHHPNDHRHGTMHIWDVWNARDYDHYRDYPARFVSEFGFQGPPAWSTLTSVVHDEPLDPYGPQMLVHQKATDGNGKLERGLGDHLPPWGREPVAIMADWHWLTSLNQARAVAFGIEHLRSHYPLNRGAIVWQLNDNWPVISWAAVDGHGIRKPLWYALRRVFADRLLTLQPRPDADGRAVARLVAHNDSGESWQGEVVITRRRTTTGTEVLAKQRVVLDLGPRSSTVVDLAEDVAVPAEVRREFVVAVADSAAPAYGYFVEDPELVVEPPAKACEAGVERTADGYAVTVRASALVKDLALFPDRLDPAARVDSGLVSLLAGESHTFAVASGELDEAALTGSPVLRSVNDLIAGA